MRVFCCREALRPGRGLLQRITIEASGDKAVIRVRDVGQPPQDLRFKLEELGQKQSFGPFGWQKAEHYIRPRGAQKAGEDLLLEVGADVVQVIPAGTPIDVEIPGLELSEQVVWPELAAGPPSAAPEAAPAPPDPGAQLHQRDARDFGKPLETPAAETPPQSPASAAPAARPSPWRAVLMLLVGLVVGAALGFASARFLAPPEESGAGAEALAEIEQQLAGARAERGQARQRIGELEAESAALRGELAQRPQAQAPDTTQDQRALDEERRKRAESEQLAERQAERIGALEAEIARLEARLAAPSVETPALDAGSVDQALARVQEIYAIDATIIARVRDQLLAGVTVKEITGALSGQLPNTARQSLYNQLCKEFPDQCGAR